MKNAALEPASLAQALIRCPSVTPAEAGALTLVEDVLKGAGFTCHRMTFSEAGTADVENLYARIGTAGPNLCFAGHTDVVPPGDDTAWTLPPFAAEIRDRVLYGRGAVDMKGAVACFMVAALRHLDAAGSCDHLHRRLFLESCPGPVGVRGEAGVIAVMVGQTDDSGVILGTAVNVTQLELL